MCVRNEETENGALLTRSLLILGPHRSGTSALTKVLNLLGVSLGEDLLPAKFDNRRGYWEHRRIFELHERLLSRAGTAWHDYRPMPLGWQDLEEVRGVRDELRGVIERELLGSPLWGVKDPRLGRLLPLWLGLLQTLDAEAHFIIVVRNPMEIIRSMERRNRFPRSKCALLYLVDTLEAIRHTEGRSRTFVSFELLLEDWRPVVERVERELGLSWPVAPAACAAEIDGFLSPSERHHTASLDDLRRDPGLPPWVADLYEALEAAARGDRHGLDSAVTTAHDAYRSAITLFAPEVDALHRELQRLSTPLEPSENDDADRDHARLERRARRAEAELAKVERHLLSILSSPLYRSTQGLRRTWRSMTRFIRRTEE